MKKILSVLLIMSMMIASYPFGVSYANEIDAYLGKYDCEVTEFAPIDFKSLKSQIDKITGKTIPPEQWSEMKVSLSSSFGKMVKDVKGEKFVLEIFDEYSTGINAEVIKNNKKIAESTGAEEKNDYLIFYMDQFINEYVKANTKILVRRGMNNTIIGQAIITQNISSNGMSLELNSVIDFFGFKMQFEDAEEDDIEIIYPEGIKIGYNGAVSNIAELNKGSKVKLTYSIYPADYTKNEVEKIEWYSNNSKIATVSSSGIVEAKTIGKTQIGIWINGDYNLSNTITIVVKEKTEEQNKEQNKEENKDESEEKDQEEKEQESKKEDNLNNKGKIENDNRNKNENIIDKVEDGVVGFADVISKSADFLPISETMSKVPLLDILVFGYEVDKDSKENQQLGDSDDYAKKKAFWANVAGAGPIGMLPKAADLALELSKQVGFDFEFSFEQTLKGINNFAFDMFSDDSKADIEDIKERHKDNHYGVIGGFGVWVSSTINDFSTRARKTNNEINNID